MAKPIKFSHVLFMTRRYDEMVAWYEEMFEATTVHRDPVVAFLTYDAIGQALRMKNCFADLLDQWRRFLLPMESHEAVTTAWT